MIEDVLADGERRQVGLCWNYDSVREVLAGHAASPDEVTEPRLVLWDLWDGSNLHLVLTMVIATVYHGHTGSARYELARDRGCRLLRHDPRKPGILRPHVK